MNEFYRSDLYRDTDVTSVLEQRLPIMVMFITDTPSIMKKERYKHYIYGSLENLQKCVIEVTDILLTIDIELQSNVIAAEKLALQGILMNNGCRKLEIVRKKPFREFFYEQKFYARCYFDCFDNRIKAIDVISNISSSMIISEPVAKEFAPNIELKSSNDKYIIGSDERTPGEIIFKLARENNISLSSWNLVTNYRVIKQVNGIICLTCSLSDIHYAPCNPNRYAIKWVADKFTIPEQYKDIKPINQLAIKESSLLIMYFDIETYTTRFSQYSETSREVPNGCDFPDTDSIFLISCVFYLSHRTDIKGDPDLVVSIFNTYGKFTGEDIRRIASKRDNKSPEIVMDKKSASDYAHRNRNNYNRVNLTTFVNSEKELLIEFTKLMGNMRPDIISGYNTGNYDIPFIVSKLVNFNIYDEFIRSTTCNQFAKNYVNKTNPNSSYKYTYGKIKFKINASTNTDVNQLNIPGILCVDTMQILRRTYPDDDKYSLNYFLEKLNLGKKEDMEYKRLFSTVDQLLTIDDSNRDQVLDSILDDIRDAIVYCEMDSALCFRLWNKEGFIMKYRNKSESSFVNLIHSFARADAKKVVNLVMAHSPHLIFEHNRNIKKFDGKFTGAYVVEPRVRGLYNKKPVEELDVVSLYPSIMRAYNKSMEMISRNKPYIKNLIDKGKIRARELKIPVGDQIEEGYVVFHENKDELKGVYVLILQYLMETRAKLKKRLEVMEEDIKHTIKLQEKVDLATDEFIKTNQKQPTPEEVYTILGFTKNDILLLDNYKENDYQYKVADAEQLTVKIFMNTFYGITGDKKGMFYELLIAASVTYFGQELLKNAHVVAKSNGYLIVYGDTDSMYVAAPDKTFKEIEEQFNGNIITKEQYYSKMCYLSKEAGDWLKDRCNELFVEMTETTNIKLSHDTTGFPSFWASKKKYAYLKQEFDNGLVPNFKPVNYKKKLYKIKGLAIVTRGQTKLLHYIGENVIYEMLQENIQTKGISYSSENIYIYYDKTITVCNKYNFDELYEPINQKYKSKMIKLIQCEPIQFTSKESYETLLRLYNIQSKPIIIKNDKLFDIVFEQIGKIFSTKWDVDDFVQSATYRPDKKNIRINKFIERMKARNIALPEVYERFKYVIVKPTKFTKIDGSFIKYNVGDLMEYPEIAKQDNREIHLQQYLNGALKGMLAKFVSYLFFERNEDNTIKLQHNLNDAESSIVETLTMRHASKLIETVIEYFSKNKATKKEEQLRAKLMFKDKINNLRIIMDEIFGNNSLLYIGRLSKFYKILNKTISVSEIEENDEESIIERDEQETDDKLEEEDNLILDDILTDAGRVIDNIPQNKNTLSILEVVNVNTNSSIYAKINIVPNVKLTKIWKDTYNEFTHKNINELLEIKQKYLERDERKNIYKLNINKLTDEFIRLKVEFFEKYDYYQFSTFNILTDINDISDRDEIIEFLEDKLRYLIDLNELFDKMNKIINNINLFREFNKYLMTNIS